MLPRFLGTSVRMTGMLRLCTVGEPRFQRKACLAPRQIARLLRPCSDKGPPGCSTRGLNEPEIIVQDSSSQSCKWKQPVWAKALISHPCAETHLQKVGLLSPSTPHVLPQGAAYAVLGVFEVVTQLASLFNKGWGEYIYGKNLGNMLWPQEGECSESFQAQNRPRYASPLMTCPCAAL